MSEPDYRTCRGKDALRLRDLCTDGDVMVRDAAMQLGRSIRYVRSIAEEFGFQVVRFPSRVGSWLIGYEAQQEEAK